MTDARCRDLADRLTAPSVPPAGLSCLHLAALTGDLQLVAHLVAHGADVACMEGKSGRTALHLAVEAGDIGLLRFLARGCGADVRATTYGGLNSYQLALLNARLDVAEVLESLGAARAALPESDVELSDSESEVGTATAARPAARLEPLCWPVQPCRPDGEVIVPVTG